ncbi:MAG: tetratricopeptide repeat protein [Chloroflexota bacterium]|nr:tetratricopeptide repeat protein [Chloroflexota bacterium]MDE2684948.1 tetratricopeptide repeat protein [Chloroflexota bacterium]
MDVILQILSVLFVVLWTARLASRKRRNMLLWAGAAALPAIAVYLIDALPDAFTILCMAPMVGLVFIPARPAADSEAEQDTNVYCPRCQHAHELGPNFCTNCGWELSRPYATDETTSDSSPAPEPVMASTTEDAAESTTVAEHPAAAPTVDPVLAAEQTAEAGAATAQPPSPASDPGPAFSAAPMKISKPLTASAMTEAGLTLFNQGRVREAVDQFTKAIALDPRYRDAWANRAKAYNELGLSDKAAADQAQLEAI